MDLRRLLGLTLGGLSPGVAMVETAEAWQRSQTGIADRLWLDRTSTRRVFELSPVCTKNTTPGCLRQNVSRFCTI
jgi:hypothetical protein